MLVILRTIVKISLRVEQQNNKMPWEEAQEAFSSVGGKYENKNNSPSTDGAPLAASTPWEEAQQMAKTAITKTTDKVKELLPWEMAQQAAREPVKLTPPAQFSEEKFKKVFANLVKQESGGRHTTQDGKLLTSEAGAEGITQVVSKTGVDPGFGVKPLQDNSEKEYLRFGEDYLKALLKEFKYDYEKALAAYNAGVGNVKKAIEKGNAKGEDWKKFLPKKKETIPYIENIMKGL